MKKSVIWLFLGLCIFALPAFCSAVQCSGGCVFNETCYAVGSVIGGQYCDFSSLTLMGQKNINESCMNDFECVSGYCIEDTCFDYLALLALNQNLSGQIANISSIIARGNCSSSPGCLNVSSITNGYNTTQICADPYIGYKCFACNENYAWNGTSCVLMACDSGPGCWAIGNLSSLGNSMNITRACASGYQCVRCVSGYSWNSSSSACYLPQTSSSSTGDSTYTPEWTSTIVIDNTQLSNGYTANLGAKERVKFTLSGYEHYVGVKSLSSSYAIVEIASVKQIETLTLGEEVKFEITDDYYKDISVKLNSVSGSKASITIKYIHESMSQTTITTTTNKTSTTGTTKTGTSMTKTTVKKTTDNSRLIWAAMIVFIIVLIAAIAFIVYFIAKRKSSARASVQQQVWNQAPPRPPMA